MNTSKQSETIYRYLETKGPATIDVLLSQTGLDPAIIKPALAGLMDTGCVDRYISHSPLKEPVHYYHVTDRSYCDFLAELYSLFDPLLHAMDAAAEMDAIARKHGVFLENYITDGYSIAFDDDCSRGGYNTRVTKHVMDVDDWRSLVERAATAAGVPLEIVTNYFSDTLVDDIVYDLGITVMTTAGCVTLMSTSLPYTGEILLFTRD